MRATVETDEKDICEIVTWEDIRSDMKYPESDNNKGYIYGVNWLDNNEDIIDVTWYKTDKERQQAIKEDNYTVINN